MSEQRSTAEAWPRVSHDVYLRPMPTAAPPYALTSPVFPLRALTAQLGRAPLGGPRESALACLTTARLALGLLPPLLLRADVRRARAAAARPWLLTLAIPASARDAALRVVDASARDDTAAVAVALRSLATACEAVLDAAAGAELETLARRLHG